MSSEHAHLFNSLVEGLELGAMVLDEDLRIEHWNRLISQRSGKDLAQAVSRPFFEVFPEGDSEAFRSTIALARERNKHVYNHWLSGAPIQLEKDSPNGTLPFQSTLFFPFDDAAGQRHFGLVCYDTSAIAESSEQLKAALKALASKQSEQANLLHRLETANSQLLQSEKLAAIGQLAAGVAHEINNPIGFVFSNLKTLGTYVRDLLRIADAIENVGGLDELRQLKASLDYAYIRGDAEALLAESEDGIDRVKKIISALKDFSHIEEDEFRLADLHRGLDTTLKVVNNELKYKAEVIKEYGDLPEVECIPSQINQVVMNLLVNAAHAIDEFGRITLRTTCDEEQVRIDIEDTGQGIEPKVLNRIFEPFFTTKPVGKGTGLGLALSYSIVQKHHGSIEVASELGKGTRFSIRLPVRQPPAEDFDR